MSVHEVINFFVSPGSLAAATWLAATGAVAAWLTIWWEVRRIQAERLIRMQSEYDSLSPCREVFWTEARNAYTKFREGQSSAPEDIQGLIRAAGAPPGLGTAELAEWPTKYGNGLQFDQRIIWAFVQQVYPAKDTRKDKVCDHSLVKKAGGDCGSFHEARAKLAKFWNKWAGVFRAGRIAKRFPAAYDQRLLLCWLEIALVQWTRDPGRGKEGLFRVSRSAMR